jgi:hypothetical protein
MIVGYLNVKRISILPSETQPPLLADADAMLPFAVALQRLQPIRGRQCHESQILRCMQLR